LLTFAQSSSYPPPFPRVGATALLDNGRVQVWNVAWPKGAPTPLHRHPYDMTGLYYAPGDRMITAVDGTKRPVTTQAGGIAWQLKGVKEAAAGANTSEQDVRALEQLWNDARARADVATLDRILADEWTVTHANGTTDTKARYLADLKSGARKFSGSVTESDVVVRFYGDTAIVTGSSDSTVSLNGQAQGGALHFTRVFVKRNGAWRMVVTQATTRQP